MPSNKTPVLGLVVPCMNEEEALPQSAQALKSKIESLVDREIIGHASKIYFVDDGSTDGTWATICQLVESDECFEGIKLTRNFGHQYAVYAGLMHAQGDALISIDADLQDDINAIDDMVEKYLAGSEIVYGVRADRHSDKRFKRWTASIHYWLSGRFGVRTIPNHADFRLLSRRAVSILSQYRETNLYLRGVVPLLGLQASEVYYTRTPQACWRVQVWIEGHAWLVRSGHYVIFHFPVASHLYGGVVRVFGVNGVRLVGTVRCDSWWYYHVGANRHTNISFGRITDSGDRGCWRVHRQDVYGGQTSAYLSN